MFNLDFINTCVRNYESRKVDELIAPNDQMNNQWYFEVGRNAVEVILAAIMSSYLSKVERVLDLPCGHGRVLRHLVNLFPEAEFHAGDLDTDGVDYCVKKFGALRVDSRPELTEVDFAARYDIIWVGSLFTHVDRARTARWLAHLARHLMPNGIVVATMHGRWSEFVHKRFPYIGADRWAKVMQGYGEGGYGYSDYVAAESTDHVPTNYGISIARPDVMVSMLEEIPGIRIYSYSERAWADHQDVLVFGLPAYDQPWG